MAKHDHPRVKKSNGKGFTLQLFFISIFPLTVLLLVVAFGSQTLHHDAMRSLVGDRDLRTVRIAANSLKQKISDVNSSLQILSRSVNEKPDFASLILTPEEISTIFDGGLALYSSNGHMIQSSTTQIDWQAIPAQIPDSFNWDQESTNQPIFSPLISSSGNTHSYVFVSVLTVQQDILVGAFSPELLIENSIGNLASSGQNTVLVIGPAKTNGKYDVLYQGGSFKMDESVPSLPGIQEVLNGESGINYFQSDEGEHVVAFSPVVSTGWGLIIEEAWEDIASPYLINTQSAPLVIVPVFLLALLVIWFGARRIVTPLQRLEKQAADLASGDFEAIRQSVGGIEEIRNLQSELIDMAEKLNAAQQNLRGYIGAITAGVENERRNLARELHDDTIQTLIALNQRIQLILMNSQETQKDELSELQTLVQKSMTNLRRMIRGLRPIYLEDLGLVASLEMLVHEMEQSTKLSISFASKGVERRVDPQSEMSLYRIVQESLNNVIQHANAEHAWITLEYTNTNFSVLIRDDGKGFTIPSNPSDFPQKGHFGLLGLFERAELINAELLITSNPGEGTIISIQLPISPSNEVINQMH
ncbi:MAG: histidine kinase [Anaerolineaceae bacterium]